MITYLPEFPARNEDVEISFAVFREVDFAGDLISGKHNILDCGEQRQGVSLCIYIGVVVSFYSEVLFLEMNTTF